MARLNVGDRGTIIASNYGHGFDIGDEVVIIYQDQVIYQARLESYKPKSKDDFEYAWFIQPNEIKVK